MSPTWTRASGVGVFVDDTRVTTGAGTLDADGFEGATRLWTVEGPPPGLPANQGDFAVTTELSPVSSSVTTEDTVLLGFGLESLATPDDRADVLGRARAPDRVPGEAPPPGSGPRSRTEHARPDYSRTPVVVGHLSYLRTAMLEEGP